MDDVRCPRVGYLVGTRQEEFLSVRRVIAPGAHVLTWSKLIDFAKVFRSDRKARRLVQLIGKPGVAVVPVYDCGSTWVVEWPEEWEIAGNRPRPLF